ncbi:MAG: lysophospholipid acyltransferase family protein [Deltaproteobacteria bacterium]|nr:lysophospholipid acyltransferase family protein [Deltaproteobacteria bacterium]MBW2349782.1 lysophospholipid acyltransferase family protein [Deltaproteobacteria bacterium]
MHAVLLRLTELWLASCRFTMVERDAIRPLFEPGHPAIATLWHASLIYNLFYFRHHPGVVMVSGSSDGEWVARFLNSWGQIPVRGSKHKGGLLAIKEMTRIMRQQGCNAGIVADGSQGPARIAQKGAVVLSRETGVPMVPTGLAAKPAFRFNSWDRTILPFPWSKVVMVCGRPISVPPDAKGIWIEEFRRNLEDSLNESTRIAEEIVG